MKNFIVLFSLFLLLPTQSFAADATNVRADFVKTDKGKLLEIFGSTVIDAPPKTVWAVMTNCAKVHEFVPQLKKCQVLAADENGQWDIRRHTGKNSFPFKGAVSEFKSTYTYPAKIVFTRTGGDYETLDGSWRLQPVLEGATKLTYRATLSAKVPLPNGLIEKAARKRMLKTLEALKTRVENP